MKNTPDLKKIIKKKKFMRIKDRAIVYFILQHHINIKIDFTKIKIPPFLNCLKKTG